MRPQIFKLSVIHSAAFLVLAICGSGAVARADPPAPAPDACNNPSGACNHAGPHYDQPGTCVIYSCPSFIPCMMVGGMTLPPGCDAGTTVAGECAHCVLADAGSADAAIEAAGGSGSTSGSVAASGSAGAAGSTAASGAGGTTGSAGAAGSTAASGAGGASGTVSASGSIAASGSVPSGSISTNQLQSSGGCSLSGPAGEAGTAAAMFGIGLASLAWGRRRRR